MSTVQPLGTRPWESARPSSLSPEGILSLSHSVLGGATLTLILRNLQAPLPPYCPIPPQSQTCLNFVSVGFADFKFTVTICAAILSSVIKSSEE